MKFELKIYLAAFIFYVITAYFSIGYFHADEHYQIIEFAGILSGTNTPDDLAWEYNAKIRPALQPVMAHLIFRACEFLKITNPFSKAFVLRLLTTLLSLTVIFYFTKACKKYIADKHWKWFLFLSYFLWFMPLINVRFTSETWSGMFLLLAITKIISPNKTYRSYLIIGSLLGFSFLFRYQVAFAIIGIGLWLIVIQKESLINLCYLTGAALMIILLGVTIDSWFYKEWVIAVLNNFSTNLLEGKASEFGESLWYYYLFLIFRYTFFPIGIIIIIALFIQRFQLIEWPS